MRRRVDGDDGDVHALCKLHVDISSSKDAQQSVETLCVLWYSTCTGIRWETHRWQNVKKSQR